MQHESLLEKRVLASPSPIDDLIRHHEIPWLHVLRETARCTEGNNTTDPEFAEGSDVGASGDFAGVEFVVDAVAGQEGDGGGGVIGRWGGVFEDENGCRGVAPWCIDRQGCDRGESGEGLEPCAADDGDFDRFCVGRGC